jgi:amidase
MISTTEYRQYDALGLATLRQEGDVSASELLNCAFELCDSENPAINAIVHQDREQALHIAQRVDTLKPPGLLAGIPFLVKEVNAVAGWPHTRGSQLFAENLATTDSAIVSRYREHNLVPFGSTNTPEFCITITTESERLGTCHNPHNLEHSTGGSSGGSAAAVAAGIVPAADASDGGGSIRIPAACCGLIGLKPSRGLTVIEGDMGSAWSGMSVSHVLTRSVRDCAAFLDILKLNRAGLFPLPAYSESYFHTHARRPRKLRIAVQTEHPGEYKVHADCLDGVEATARQLERLDHHLEYAIPPVDYTQLSKAMATLINVHLAQIVAPGLDARGISTDTTLIAESTRRMVARGVKTTAAQYLAALDAIKRTEQLMTGFHQQFDLVLSPVMAMPPARLGWLDMNAPDIHEYARRYMEYSPFTALYNGTGQPSISLPMHQCAGGLPIGVMLSAPWGNDHVLLQLASQLLPDIIPAVSSRASPS